MNENNLIEKLKDLNKKATTGPWVYDSYKKTIIPGCKCGPTWKENLDVSAICKIRNRETGTDNLNLERDSNADLIAASRNAIPALIELIEEMAAALAVAREQVEAVYRHNSNLQGVPSNEDERDLHIILAAIDKYQIMKGD
jgi:hypothetical protein